MVDIRHDLSEMFLAAVDDADPDELEAAFDRMGPRAARCSRPRASRAMTCASERSIAMRYLGQWRSMESQ